MVATTLFSLIAAATGWLMIPVTDARVGAAAGDAPNAMAVTDATSRRVDWPIQLEASGTIAPWQEAVIGSQVNGLQLTELHVGPGDVVRRGQVLARFDTQSLSADVAQLRAGLRHAEAQAAQARTNRDRAHRLKDSGSISEEAVLQSVTQAETATAQVESSQAQLLGREVQLQYATVRSPDDGVINARSATIGTVSKAGEELFRLIRQNRLEWRGELTAAQFGQVAKGQLVTLALPDGLLATAKVRQLAPSLNSQTRLGLIYADVVPGSSARAGMYAQGQIIVVQKAALVVPAGSVVVRDGRSHVFKLGTLADSTSVSLQAVKIGRRQSAEVEIVEGLGDGDRVVVHGAGFLNDGDKVSVVRVPLVAQRLTVDASHIAAAGQ